MVQQINENMIREAAYFLWEKAGRPDGSAEYFWMKACEQFFKPKKVEIKKPVAKKKVPAKKVATPAKKTPASKPAKPAIKVMVKPVAAPSVKVKPVVKVAAKKPVATPFYGSRK